MGNFYMESTQINYRRDEKLKTVDQKLQELSETSAIDTDIAPVFKSTNTYQPGDMVYYRNKLYVFNVEHTGAWAAADVTATDVTTELSSLNSNLTSLDVAVNVPDNAGKNLLPFTLASLKALNASGTWADNVYTKNGVEFTVNTNASGQVISIVADGTATGGNADFDLTSNASIPDASKGLLYSGCPSGSASTYGLCRSGAGIIQFGGNDVAWPTSVTAVTTFIRVINEATCDNVTFTPMLRDSRITDATFAPYIPSVESRIEAVESGLTNLKLTDIRRYEIAPTDLNEIIPTRPLSLYQVGNMNNYTNRPTGAGVTGILLVMTLASYTLQLWISYEGMSIRYTFDGGTNWTNWTNVTMAS